MSFSLKSLLILTGSLALLLSTACSDKNNQKTKITDPSQITVDPQAFEQLPKDLGDICQGPRQFKPKDIETFKDIPLMGALYSKGLKQSTKVKAHIDDQRMIKLDEIGDKPRKLSALFSTDDTNIINLKAGDDEPNNLFEVWVCPDNKSLKVVNQKQLEDFYYLTPAETKNT